MFFHVQLHLAVSLQRIDWPSCDEITPYLRAILCVCQLCCVQTRPAKSVFLMWRCTSWEDQMSSKTSRNKPILLVYVYARDFEKGKSAAEHPPSLSSYICCCTMLITSTLGCLHIVPLISDSHLQSLSGRQHDGLVKWNIWKHKQRNSTWNHRLSQKVQKCSERNTWSQLKCLSFLFRFSTEMRR